MNLVSMVLSLYVLVVQHERKLTVTKTLAITHKESLKIIMFTGLLLGFSHLLCSAHCSSMKKC